MNFMKLFLVIVIAFIGCHQRNNKIVPTKENVGFNNHPVHIYYSKHAKCRMECRHINETEIKEVLETGTINYKKSNLQMDDCHKRYAVEGYSKENQQLRLIVASCNNELTVITCIDLGEEWKCHCPGDE